MSERVYLSRAKHEEFTLKLDRLKKVDFPENRIEMKAAMQGGGGMHDNAAYEHAAQREKILLQQIAELENLLTNSRIIEENDIDTSSVRIGTKVRLVDLDKKEEIYWIIGGAYDTDVDKNIISYQAPVANGLLGKSIGDTVEIKVPKGILHLRILSIERK